MEFVEKFLTALAMVAPFLLLGFLVAGLLHAFVPRSLLARAMGGTGLGPITRASVMGIPLPLCSCSVIPVATELRKQGAGRGATTAFMVATPETGVDSISTSIAVLNPVLVLVRPIAAMVTSVVAGLAVERFTVEPPAAPEQKTGGCCKHDAAKETRGPARGLLGGIRYAFDDLLGEISPYLLPALLLTAAVGLWLDPAIVAEWDVAPWLQRVVLLVGGIPVYVCATSATPVAAALMVAGISPGAALIFLLAGPATNLVTISAVRSALGRGSATVYVLAVALVSFGFGTVLDLFWSDLAGDSAAATLHREHLSWVHQASAALLGALIAWHIGRKLAKRFRKS